MFLPSLLLIAQLPAVTGAWDGTSICLANKPVCKDERVVYHFVTGPDSTRLSANKIVNGMEEEMGEMACAVTAREVICPMPKQFRPGTWKFTRNGESLDGGLWMADGTQVREVHVRRRS